LKRSGSEFASATTFGSRNGKRPSTEFAIIIRSPCDDRIVARQQRGTSRYWSWRAGSSGRSSREAPPQLGHGSRAPTAARIGADRNVAVPRECQRGRARTPAPATPPGPGGELTGHRELRHGERARYGRAARAARPRRRAGLACPERRRRASRTGRSREQFVGALPLSTTLMPASRTSRTARNIGAGRCAGTGRSACRIMLGRRQRCRPATPRPVVIVPSRFTMSCW